MVKKSKWQSVNTKFLKTGFIYRINRKVHDFIEESKNNKGSISTTSASTAGIICEPLVIPALIEYEQFLMQYENCIDDAYKNPTTWIKTDSLYWRSTQKPNLVQVICNCDFFEIKKNDTLIFLDHFNINKFYDSLVKEHKSQANDYKDLMDIVYDGQENYNKRYDPLLLFFNPKTQQKYFLMSSDEIVGIEQNSGYNFLDELIE